MLTLEQVKPAVDKADQDIVKHITGLVGNAERDAAVGGFIGHGGDWEVIEGEIWDNMDQEEIDKLNPDDEEFPGFYFVELMVSSDFDKLRNYAYSVLPEDLVERLNKFK